MARSRLVLIPLLFLIGQPTATSEEPSRDEKKDLERLAPKFKFFATIDFIYDRGPDLGWWTPKAVHTDYRRFMAELTVPKRVEKQVIDLLKHRDPRVRTLAMAVLFAREDPKLLPHIAELVNDEAETFKIPVPSGGGGGGPPPTRKYIDQTVGEIAQEMLGLYVTGGSSGPIGWRLAGWGGNGITPHDFNSYWAKRKDRNFCVSWFAAQFERASGGTIAYTPDRIEKVRAVRRRIEQLPKADRAWILLALSQSCFGGSCLMTEMELIDATKELGAEKLMAMLQSKIPSDDPDLEVQNRYFSHIREFVLQHGGQLLRRQDADFLLKNGWVIPAAELLPEKAQELLRQALRQVKDDGVFGGDERANLAVALWRVLGPSQIPFLVEWLYERKPQNDWTCHIFLDQIVKLRKPENRKLVAKIIEDKRLEKLDWWSLDILGRAVNSWLDKPAVPKDDYTIDEWLNALRASVPRWNK